MQVPFSAFSLPVLIISFPVPKLQNCNLFWAVSSLSFSFQKQSLVQLFFPCILHLCFFYARTTGCFNAKSDVFNCSCDLDFELLVFWVVEIYAWSTIGNIFDLRQPQQKSVKIQMCFCSFFVQVLIILFLFWAYMTQYFLRTTACL